MPWRTVLDTLTDVASNCLVSDQAALELDSENKFPCTHDQRGVFEVLVGSMQRPRYELCINCGRLLRAIAKRKISGKPIFFDHVAAQKSFANIRYKRRIAIVADDAAKNGHAVRERKHNYPDYLRSEEWQQKRRAVLLRAKFICEKCSHEQATEVHHLTYERIFFERLEDLMAICGRCHSQLHSDIGARYRAPKRLPSSELPCLACRWFNAPNTCTFFEMPVGAALIHDESCGSNLRGFEKLN